jgi:pimeloyl-ACP methyl ester carboxylesterase
MAPVIKSVELPNGVILPYAEQGDPAGVSILLLHGFAASWRSFGSVLDHLPTSFHAFAFTQRGHGNASKPAAGYHVRDFATDLAAFMDAIHIQTAVVAGHSMGSAVALRFAIDHPEHTLGLVLAGASPSLRANPGARQFWEVTISKLSDPVDPGFLRLFVKGMLTSPLPEALFETIVQESRKVPAHV